MEKSQIVNTITRLHDAGYRVEELATTDTQGRMICTYTHPTERTLTVILDKDGDSIKLFLEIRPDEVGQAVQFRDPNMTSAGWDTNDIREGLDKFNEDRDGLALAMDDEQIDAFLQENAEELDEFTVEHGVPAGWDKLNDLLGEVAQCESCGRAMNLTDDELSHQRRGEGPICTTCKEIGNYKSCAVCDLYEQASAMVNKQNYDEPSETLYFHPDCLAQSKTVRVL